MIAEFIPFFGILFGVGMPLSIVIVFLVLFYRQRRRLLELHHAERMAAIERGMEVPPLPLELLEGRRPRRRRSTLLPGLVSALVGVALLVSDWLIGARNVMLVAGLIVLAVGLGYLIYYFLEGRALEAKWNERELAGPGRPGAT